MASAKGKKLNKLNKLNELNILNILNTKINEKKKYKFKLYKLNATYLQ